MYARRPRLQELRHEELTRAVDANKVYENQSNEFYKISKNSGGKFLQRRLKEEAKEQAIEDALQKVSHWFIKTNNILYRILVLILAKGFH